MDKDIVWRETDSTKPGMGSKTVTPSDTAEIWEGELARELHVLSAGAVVIVGADGATDTWTIGEDMVPYVIPVAVSKVLSTGTTAEIVIKAVR